MTTIRQLIQTSPAKANELFAKLTETSGNAVKTREKLFADLKSELELQIKLEEQHLFPVLKKRKETKDLVSGALNDNKQTRKLLTELERTPKESEEFASKVAELRKAFQQHVRDERKELLPAVLKALDDEEAEAIVEKIEGAKAEAEAAKRAEAEAARAAREEREKAEAVARQEREQVETVRQAAESVGNVVRVSAEAPRRAAETAREAVQSGVGVAAQMAQRAADFGMGSFSDVTRRWQNAAASMTAVSQANSGLVMRYQGIWREFFQLAHQATQERTESVTRLMSARSPQQLLDANVDLSSARCRGSSMVRPGCPSFSPMRPAMPSSGSRSVLRREGGEACPGQGDGRPETHRLTARSAALSPFRCSVAYSFLSSTVSLRQASR